MTLRVAAAVFVLPQSFEKTARYVLPFCALVAVNDSVVFVAPGMLLNPLPELTCHCTVGAGDPLAAAVNVAVPPSHTSTLTGLVSTDGPVLTVNVAAAEVSLPPAFVNTARYLLPPADGKAVNVNVVLVAPRILVKLAPPSVLTCH